MMPKTEFAQYYTDFSIGARDATAVLLVGNFALNVILSGAMTLLWGLLHCMQIVTHFPLINVMMPSNANQLF